MSTFAPTMKIEATANTKLLDSEPLAVKTQPGPQSQLQRKFEQVKLLPREKQKFILQFLDTVLESSRQKQKA
ncbi:MAG: hypothetical protein ABJA66_08510 [Actinomycetota bacterium]